MKSKRNLQNKFVDVMTISNLNYPNAVYPINALDLLLELQKQ